jgi:hypothetical protein
MVSGQQWVWLSGLKLESIELLILASTEQKPLEVINQFYFQ